MTKIEIEAKIKEVEQNISETKKILKKQDAELKKLKAELAKLNIKDNAENVIKEIDNIFTLVDKSANAIILSACCGDYADCFYGYCEDTTFGMDFPTPDIHLRGTYNTWCECDDGSTWTSEHGYKYHDALENFTKFINKLDDTILPFPEDIFDHSDGINEYWSGYIALTRDYKLVTFVCRNDSMMLNRFEVAPDVIYDFANMK